MMGAIFGLGTFCCWFFGGFHEYFWLFLFEIRLKSLESFTAVPGNSDEESVNFVQQKKNVLDLVYFWASFWKTLCFSCGQ